MKFEFPRPTTEACRVCGRVGEIAKMGLERKWTNGKEEFIPGFVCMGSECEKATLRSQLDRIATEGQS